MPGMPTELCADCKTRLEKNPLRLLDCKQPSCQAMADAAPRSADHLCPECATHFTELQRYLGLLGIPFKLNHRLVRGLDYYTRTVFEIQPEEEGGQSTIGGGGQLRRPYRGAGRQAHPGHRLRHRHRAGHPEPEEAGRQQCPPLPPLQVLIAAAGRRRQGRGVKAGRGPAAGGHQRGNGGGRKSLKAQLRQANALGVRYTVIIGEDEVKAARSRCGTWPALARRQYL